MKQRLFEDYPEEQRIQMLEDNASQVTKGKYTRRLTPAEKNIKRKRVCELDIELNDIEEELKAVREDFKERKTPLINEKSELLSDIKNGGVYVEGNLYKIVDRESKEVGYYNDEGELVEQRKMTKEDLQLSINEAVSLASNM